jgi:large subunit ribosomal protein L13
MKTLFISNKYINPKYIILNADGQILGRFATKISKLLSGKDKITFINNVFQNTFVIVYNLDKLKITGKKYLNKNYYRNSQRPGSLKKENYKSLMNRLPQKILEHAVKGMLPKTSLGRKYFSHLYFLNNNSLNKFFKDRIIYNNK